MSNTLEETLQEKTRVKHFISQALSSTDSAYGMLAYGITNGKSLDNLIEEHPELERAYRIAQSQALEIQKVSAELLSMLATL